MLYIGVMDDPVSLRHSFVNVITPTVWLPTNIVLASIWVIASKWLEIYTSPQPWPL